METNDIDLKVKEKAPRAVFALFGATDPEQLKTVVETVYSDTDRLALKTGDWLISASTKQVSQAYEQLASIDGSLKFVIVRVDHYYGLYDTAVWDWIQAKRDGI